jgi:hypothetical protein
MLPSGSNYNFIFSNLKSYANIWTITRGTLEKDAWYFGAAFNFSNPSYLQALKTNGLSIRCLKD